MLQYDDDVNETEFTVLKEEDFPSNIYLFKVNNNTKILQKHRNTKIDVLELVKSQSFCAPNHGEGKIKKVSKSYLHVPFFPPL